MHVMHNDVYGGSTENGNKETGTREVTGPAARR